MQVAELHSLQFLSDPKTDLAFPFLSAIFHPYLSFLPQAWPQLFLHQQNTWLFEWLKFKEWH